MAKFDFLAFNFICDGLVTSPFKKKRHKMATLFLKIIDSMLMINEKNPKMIMNFPQAHKSHKLL